MEIDWTGAFKQRLLFKSGQAFVKQLEKWENFRSLQPVYGVGFLATNLDESEHWYHHYPLVNVRKPTREILEHLQLVFIELKKFPIASPGEKRLRILWLRFLREIKDRTEQISKDLFEVPEISQAIELAQEAAYSNAELAAYDDYWKAVSTEKTRMSSKFDEGEKKGFLKGMRKGLLEAEKKGMLEALLRVARQLKEEGMSHTLISECTGLSEDSIRDV
jgi:predicted transposase/invertase (TIGR01784 family)